MESLLQDFRYAARSLARSPALTVAAVATLGLGIGANTAMFGVVDQLFFRPPAHVVDPGSVKRLNVTQRSSRIGSWTSSVATYPRYVDFRDRARSFSAVAAYADAAFSLGLGQGAERIRGEIVTASFFPLLGVRPALGRFFTADEDRVGAAAHVAVLSTKFWKRRFAGDTGILGQELHLGRSVYTVIGVAPPGFAGIDLRVPDLWVPMSAAAPEVQWPEFFECGGCYWLETMVRLRPGVSAAQAGSEGTVIFRSHIQQSSDSTATVSLGSVHESPGPQARTRARLSIWLSVVCGIVLLIACANVTNLLLARAVQRRREIAVRLALGAGRARLARGLLVESAVLAGLGGAAALVITLWLGPVLHASLLPYAPTPTLDGRIAAFAAIAVLATTLLAGVAPAWQASAPDLSAALKAGAREGTVQRSNTRTALLVGQIALSLVLLTGAGLFISSLRRVQSLPLGFDAERLISASVDLASVGYGDADINAAYERMRQRVRALPGVESASLAVGSPFGSGFVIGLEIPGHDSLPKTFGPYVSAITPEYFQTLGTRVLRGRGFDAQDKSGAEPVVVVNQTMAKLYWPGEDALGRCVRLGRRPARCFTVVGIVEDARRGSLTEGPEVQYFLPLAQADSVVRNHVTALLVRTAGRASDLTGAVRREIQASVPDLPYPNIDPMPSLFARELRPWRLGSALLSLFGLLGLLLASIGLYGVLSYIVSQRTQELSIRIALGADRRDLLRLVVRQGLRVTLIGVACGAVGALFAGKAIASLLYEVSPRNPLVLTVVGLVLIMVALLACYVPARRATRVDPMVALRTE